MNTSKARCARLWIIHLVTGHTHLCLEGLAGQAQVGGGAHVVARLADVPPELQVEEVLVLGVAQLVDVVGKVPEPEIRDSNRVQSTRVNYVGIYDLI